MIDDILGIEVSEVEDPEGEDKIAHTIRSEDPEVIKTFDFFHQMFKTVTDNQKYSKSGTWIFIMNIARDELSEELDDVEDLEKQLTEASDI
jgi:hypothetical protein